MRRQIGERFLALTEKLSELASRHEARALSRVARVRGREERCAREEERVTEQRGKTGILFFDRQSDGVKRDEDAATWKLAAEELQADELITYEAIKLLAEDRAWLGGRREGLHSDLEVLAKGNPRLVLEQGSGEADLPPEPDPPADPELQSDPIGIGQSATPSPVAAPEEAAPVWHVDRYSGERDAVLEGFCKRRAHVDEEVDRLRALTAAEQEGLDALVGL